MQRRSPFNLTIFLTIFFHVPASIVHNWFLHLYWPQPYWLHLEQSYPRRPPLLLLWPFPFREFLDDVTFANVKEKLKIPLFLCVENYSPLSSSTHWTASNLHVKHGLGGNGGRGRKSKIIVDMSEVAISYWTASSSHNVFFNVDSLSCQTGTSRLTRF